MTHTHTKIMSGLERDIANSLSDKKTMTLYGTNYAEVESRDHIIRILNRQVGGARYRGSLEFSKIAVFRRSIGAENSILAVHLYGSSPEVKDRYFIDSELLMLSHRKRGER